MKLLQTSLLFGLLSAIAACGGVENAAAISGMTASNTCADDGDGNHIGIDSLTNEECVIIAPAQNLHMKVYSQTSAELFWARPAQGAGYVGARILRDGVEIANVDGTSYTDQTRTANQTHVYSVFMIHSSGAESLPANVSEENPEADAAVGPFDVGQREATIDIMFGLQKGKPIEDMADLFATTHELAVSAGWTVDVVDDDERIYSNQVQTGTYVDPDTGYEGTYEYVHNYAVNDRYLCPEGGTIMFAKKAQYLPSRDSTHIADECGFNGAVFSGKLVMSSAIYTSSTQIAYASYTRGEEEFRIENGGIGRSGAMYSGGASADLIVANSADYGHYKTPNYKAIFRSSNSSETNGLPTGYDYNLTAVYAEVLTVDDAPMFILSTENSLYDDDGVLSATTEDGANLALTRNDRDYEGRYDPDLETFTATYTTADGDVSVEVKNGSIDRRFTS